MTGEHRPAVLVIAATALAVARDEGCACDPDIEVGSRAGKLAVRVWHDSWCPLALAIAAPTN